MMIPMRRLRSRRYRASEKPSSPPGRRRSSSTRAGGSFSTNLRSAEPESTPVVAIAPIVEKIDEGLALKLFVLHHDDVGTGILGPGRHRPILTTESTNLKNLDVKTAPRGGAPSCTVGDLGGADRRSVGGVRPTLGEELGRILYP